MYQSTLRYEYITWVALGEWLMESPRNLLRKLIQNKRHLSFHWWSIRFWTRCFSLRLAFLIWDMTSFSHLRITITQEIRRKELFLWLFSSTCFALTKPCFSIWIFFRVRRSIIFSLVLCEHIVSLFPEQRQHCPHKLTSRLRIFRSRFHSLGSGHCKLCFANWY